MAYKRIEQGGKLEGHIHTDTQKPAAFLYISNKKEMGQKKDITHINNKNKKGTQEQIVKNAQDL